jgi:hypothetical protein
MVLLNGRKIGVNLVMRLSSTKRRLNRLWKRRRNLEVKVNLLLNRRFGRLREGTISSEEFEKSTGPERKLDRVNKQIATIEKRLWRPRKRVYRLQMKATGLPKRGSRSVSAI